MKNRGSGVVVPAVTLRHPPPKQASGGVLRVEYARSQLEEDARADVGVSI
jgi:hypothetical protein